MHSSRSLRVLLVFSIFLSTLSLNAQTTDALGTYSPYSMFGIGEIVKEGTAFNLSMGGIGIGVRDNRFINYVNPAAITERDTLSFMLDFGMYQKNHYNTDYKTKSAYNVVNMHNIALTMPIWRKSAFIVGISPFSNTGYKFETTETDDHLVAELGDIKYQKYGTGSINQLFVGASLVFLKYFSFGAQGIYYFGSLNKRSNVIYNSVTTHNSLYSGWEYKVHSFSGKFGLQYEQPFKKSNSILTIGATYRLGNKMNGDIIRYAYASSDTVLYNNVKDIDIKIASEMGLGFSFRKDNKWLVGFDYLRQNWTKSDFNTPGVNFTPAVSQSYRAGFEIVPNRYDARYYMKRVTYRGGAYYDQSYISFNGHQVNSMGLTFGMSLPIYKWYNAVSVAVDLGQRGMKKDELVRERYINFIININLHDIWFIKYRYD